MNITAQLRALLDQRFHGAGRTAHEFAEDGVLHVRETSPTLRYRAAALEPEARKEGDDEVVSASISSEAAVMVWGEREILSHHADDCDVSRLRDVGAVLKNHNAGMIVGKPRTVTLDGASRKARMDFTFGTTDDAKKARQEVLVDKTLRGVSAGFVVSEWVYLKDATQKYRDITGPAWVAAKWQLIEASLTPIPADPNVGVGREQSNQPQQEKTQMKPTPEQLAAMTPAQRAAAEADLATGKPTPTTAAPTGDDTAAREAAVTAERARSAAITKLCARHQLDPAPFIEKGNSVDEVRAAIIEKIEKAQPSTAGAEVTRDGDVTFTEAAADSLLLRMGKIDPTKVRHGGNELANLTLYELAQRCLKQKGVNVRSHDKREVARLALMGSGAPIGRMDVLAMIGVGGQRGAETITGSTGDFPLILAATAYKSLLDEYNAVPVNYDMWCGIGSVSDFKEVKRIELADAGDLQAIPELQPYPTAKFAERQEGNQVFTFGKKFSMSRQALINDDLSAFVRIPSAFGRSARRLPQNLAVKKLLQNPVLAQDQIAVFAAGHNNLLTGTGYALDTLAHAEAAFKAARAMLLKQKAYLHADEQGGDSTYINLLPKVVLVNADDEFIATQAVGSVTALAATAAGQVNPIATWGLKPIIEQNIANTNWSGTATQWFLCADPKEAPVVELLFLNGDRMPFMEQEDQTDVDGRTWRVRLDVGAGAVGYRGIVKITGAPA